MMNMERRGGEGVDLLACLLACLLALVISHGSGYPFFDSSTR